MGNIDFNENCLEINITGCVSLDAMHQAYARGLWSLPKPTMRQLALQAIVARTTFGPAKNNSNKKINGGASVQHGSTDCSMSATSSSGSSGIADNSSGATWFCGYCGRTFDTKSGLGVHKRRAHPDELNTERMTHQRPSRGTGQRNAISSRRLWTLGEITALAKLDLDLRKANPNMSETTLNKELASKLPGRSAEAIKGQKKGSPFRQARKRVCETNTEEQTPVPVHTTSDAVEPIVLPSQSIRVSGEIEVVQNNENEANSQENTVANESDPESGEIEVVIYDGQEANLMDNSIVVVGSETNVSSVVDSKAQSSLPVNASSNRADEANGENMIGETEISRIRETRLNYVDFHLLAKLEYDALLYAKHIRRNVCKSYKVKLLLHILNMNRGSPSIPALLEGWLDKVVNMVDGEANKQREPKKRRQPKIRKGNGDGRGLRGSKRLEEKMYLQKLYEKRGVKGIAQHVLRDVDFDINLPITNSTPSPEAMTEFWSDVFGTNMREGGDIKSISDEDSTANCLWVAITQEDVKRTELAKGKAKGPDGISVAEWKSVPRSVRALFYNVVIYHGVVLESLANARTIFIPKVPNPSKPGEYRPISITSVIQRQLHRIFVNRLNEVRKFDDRQVAFRNGVDGASNNLATLRTIIGLEKWKRRGLHIVSLDLKKAFDSVSHDAVFQTMSDLKCPTVFVNYLKRLYSTAQTSLELGNGECKTIRIGRGVFQGDPLSPIIFNHIIDRALKKLDDDMGYPCGEHRVTCMAFADDITVIGDSPAGTQLNVNKLVNELAKFGLQVNPSKCLALSMMTDGHRKIPYLDTSDKFSINGENIKSITPTTKWKYLGINWTGEKIDKQLPNISLKLDRVKNALLKPQQKLEIINKVIIPGVFHQAILGNSTQEELSSIDIQVRKTVRGIMHFPHDIPTVYMHAPVRCGGLGVPELLIRIPYLRYTRMKKFADSDAKAAPQFDRSIAFRHNTEKIIDFLRQNELRIEDRGVGVVIKYYLAQLDHNFATKGLSEAFYSRQTRNWCNTWSNDISGGDFIKYHLISSCSIPTLARRAWGRPNLDVSCRHGCATSETLQHIQQQCILTHGGRSLRHNRALDLIYNSIVQKFEDRFQVEKEPQLQTPLGLRKPDLILHGGDTAIVIDLNIVGNESMGVARGNKVAKYRDLPGFTRVVKERYNVDEVSYYAITMSYCGIIERLSRELLRELEFTSRDIFKITTSVLRGSWLNWFQFKKHHQQRFFDLRHQA